MRSGKRGDVLRAVPLLSWGGTPAQAPTQIDSEESRKLTLSREREEEEGPQPGVRGFCLTTPQAALGGRECLGARRKPTAKSLNTAGSAQSPLRLPSNSDCRKEDAELGAEEPEPNRSPALPHPNVPGAVLKIHLGVRWG